MIQQILAKVMKATFLISLIQVQVVIIQMNHFLLFTTMMENSTWIFSIMRFLMGKIFLNLT